MRTALKILEISGVISIFNMPVTCETVGEVPQIASRRGLLARKTYPFSPISQPLGRREKLKIELITNGQWFNHSCL